MNDSVSNKSLRIKVLISCILYEGYKAFILCILVVSCSAPNSGHRSLLSGSFDAPVSWFNSDAGHYLFNTSIDVMKNHFSGITIVKPLGIDHFRTIMMTETGLKLMDLELTIDSAPKVHYIMEPMNKSILINTLSGDISLMLMHGLANKIPAWYHYGDKLQKSSREAEYLTGRQKLVYTVGDGKRKPDRAMLLKGNKLKVSVSFYGDEITGPDSIELLHNNINLSIRLFRIIE